MHGLSRELICVLLRMRVMCSEIAGNVFDQVAGAIVNSAIVLAAARSVPKSTRSGQLMSGLGRGWSNSFMEHMGFVMTNYRV